MTINIGVACLALSATILSVLPLGVPAQSAHEREKGPVAAPAKRRSARTEGAQPPFTYHVIDLGTLNTDPAMGQILSTPAGINEAGVVAGTSIKGTSHHAARFTYGLAEDMGVIPGGQISNGVGINDNGVIVGDSQYSVNGGSIRHAAVFYAPNNIQDIGFLPNWGNYGRATGINNSNVVVGYSGASLSTSNTHAFIWDAANGMRDIGTLGGGYAKAFSINDSQQVTGTSQVGTGFGALQAFIWDQAAGMRPIPTIGGVSSSGNFINENGHVAGTSTINNFDNRQHAFLWDGSVTHDLGAIGDNDFFTDRSSAAGVNIHDEVVGSTYRPYAGGAIYEIPFVYRGGVMYDLEQLTDASGADYRLYAATGINDAGQIAVNAIKISTNQTRSVLLTPNITVSGRLVTAEGRGLRSATVTLTNANGQTYSVAAGRLGQFTIPNVPAGLTYTATVVSRRFAFPTRMITPMGDTTVGEWIAERR
jgi:probable HAF family extracellular repeat protein